MTEFIDGFAFVLSRSAMMRARSLDGTEQALTSTIVSKLKLLCRPERGNLA
jgi:hypothetical protein